MVSLSLKANGTLLHRQLFVLLEQQIARGHYRDGEQLPTQEALCAQFSVSRITVRRALADLQAAGLIRNAQGVGAFVTAPKSVGGGTPSLGFVDDMRRVVDETTMKIVGIGLERCPATVAAMLGLGADEPALKVVRIRSKQRLPVLLLEAWMPARFQPVVTPAALKRSPLYQLLIGHDQHVGRVVQEINATLADPAVAQALQIDVNSAVLRIDRLLSNDSHEPIQVLTIWSSPSRSRMVMELAGTDVEALGNGRLMHDVG